MGALLDFQSVVMILIGALIFAAALTWTYERFEDLQNETTEASSDLVSCSELNIRFVDQIQNETHYTVYFQSNRPVEELLIEFNGASVQSKIVEDIKTNKIHSSTVRMTNVDEINAEARECGTVTN